MADHGHVEYATADGNDITAHEGGYEQFVHLAFVAAICVINIVLGLAIGAVEGHWFTAICIIFIFAPIVAAHGLLSGATTPSGVLLALSVLALALGATG
jgi:hypothetical protein